VAIELIEGLGTAKAWPATIAGAAGT